MDCATCNTRQFRIEIKVGILYEIEIPWKLFLNSFMVQKKSIVLSSNKTFLFLFVTRNLFLVKYL